MAAADDRPEVLAAEVTSIHHSENTAASSYRES